jgi:beta-glucosidase
LLKNDELLPLSKNIAKIHVSGKRANDVGAQCGGWTISWQGDNGDITPGTTVLKAIQNSVSSSTEVTYSMDGSNSEGATAAVVVIGEDPYAEMQGDKETLDLDPDDIAALQRINSAGVPMVVVMLSGRPLIIDDYIKNWSGFIAAWLPGTEAAGITDIIFGDYSPTGKLSYSWPKKTSQLPFNSRTENYDPLLPLGFGLSY